eukprot:TRINITY_DN9602_c0_g1_i1.p1 TRINITY_DN9602_c0_g1~~TRINITY_DN9602_c0_g1_i1.p1  ORF type:complete len:465 (-),score=36.68 TRINITY_DN9602_c0_g1_i1:43-1437(-)
MHSSKSTSSEKFWTRVYTEIKLILWLGVPVTFSFFLYNFLSMIVLFMAGQLSPSALGAAALGMMLFNVLGEGVANGVMSAMDTLCSQAYGAGNLKSIGLILQKTCLLMLLLFFPIVLVWVFTEKIMLALGQDPLVSKLSAQFMQCMIPGLFFLWLFEIVRRFLLCQGITLPPFVVNIIVLPIHLGISYLLIFTLDIGFIGAPIALSIAFFLLFILLAVYTLWMKLYLPVWDGFKKEAFFGWGILLKLGIPGAVMLCAEWVSFEIHSIMSGWINTPSLAAQSALINTIHLLFMFPFGSAIAAATRVGHLLGSKLPQEAKFTSIISLFLGFIIALIVFVVLFFTRHLLARLFSSDPVVIEIIARLTSFLGVVHIVDAIQGIAGGILRGCGKQSLGAIVYVIFLAGIGIPLGYTLAFLESLGISGLWIGMLMAMISISIVFVMVIWFQDWQKVSEKAARNHGTEVFI